MYAIDTHAHLDQLENLDQALANARSAHVKGIVALSMDVESCRKNLAIKEKANDPAIYLGMGIHPAEAKEELIAPCIELIREHHKECQTIGEIGLDFWYKWARKDEVVKETQRKVFRALLQSAKEYNLPAVVHARGTWQECFDILQEMNITQAEFHWYSGPIDVLKKILDAGYFVSTSPSVASSPQSREAMSFAPVEQTLIETDCPVFYKTGEGEDGFKSEPKDVFRTLKAYCDLKKLDEQKTLDILNSNAKRFFKIAHL
jgi:TatD DNase family protein